MKLVRRLGGSWCRWNSSFASNAITATLCLCTVWTCTASGQPSEGPGDGMGDAPALPSPLSMMIAGQQTVYPLALNTPWSATDLGLPVSDPVHEPGTWTIGSLLSTAETYTVDCYFASTIDWTSYPFETGEKELFDLAELQVSYITARLTGSAGTSPFIGMCISMMHEGNLLHRVIVIKPITEYAAYNWQILHDVYFGYRALHASCGNEPGEGDANFTECAAAAADDAGCRAEKLRNARRNTALIGGGVALLGCGSGIFFPNPASFSACWGGVAALSGAAVCFENAGSNISSNYQHAFSCCCSALKCRNDGGTGCQSTGDCNGGCPDISCWP